MDHNFSFVSHPAYQQLIKKLQSGIDSNHLTKVVEVSGVPFILQTLLIDELQKHLQKNCLYISQDSWELRKYIDSSVFYNLKELRHGQLVNLLLNNDFKHVFKIENVGEYEIKGDLIYFWPVGYKHPLRVSYFGDTFEQADLVDEIYGKTYASLNTVLLGELKKLETKTSFNQIYIPITYTQNNNLVISFVKEEVERRSEISFDFEYAQLYFKRFDLLIQDLIFKSNNGYVISIFSKHTDTLPKEIAKYATLYPQEIDAGFESKTIKILYLSDRELFGTIFLSQQTRKLSHKKARQILAALEGEIEIDDYVVHEDYGIGIYKGIKQEEFTENVHIGMGEYKKVVTKEDYLLIAYEGSDELFVPLSQIDKITKYISTDDQPPALTRFGRADWRTLKNKVKESIMQMAKELVEHYALREIAKAPQINQELHSEYQQFVNDFPYQETADQLQTEKDILNDLHSDKPMNRLVVGDVGFGKTEVAMRAAYKAVQSGLQVAVLCPTTVLTAQHEKVFADRFANTGVQIAALSRFNKTSNKQTINEIAGGKVDIVIGTHRLLSADIKFKKLGLLIIDEEQKFGVKQKEKLKKLEYGVHVLGLSATPIPRTLSMALSSIQEISIIQTPPEGRKSIVTKVEKMNYSKICEAILYEVQRQGQVYYVHNRVQTILSVAKKLQKLLPQLRFVVAHGQMDPIKLKQIMDEFYQGKYDCLICTTIIENGLDMPNVNTIIIEKAQNFGLGQLYQLRGRVGRSDKQSFAYLFYDGEDLDQEIAISDEMDPAILEKRKQRQKYKLRLQALKEASELGAGFRLASRDLEIRGAGNLLGKQQHGNISQIGYGLYTQMLAEEIDRLKSLQSAK